MPVDRQTRLVVLNLNLLISDKVNSDFTVCPDHMNRMVIVFKQKQIECDVQTVKLQVSPIITELHSCLDFFFYTQHINPVIIS